MPEIVSYCFRDSNGRVVDSLNMDYPLMPASNMKIVSGYTAYSRLGRDYAMKTRFGFKDGSLIVSGDPSLLLTAPLLSEAITEPLKGKDVNRILFSPAVLDRNPYADGWSIEDIGYCYQTMVVPYSIDEGCLCDSGKEDGCREKPLHDVAHKCVSDQLKHFSEEAGKALGISKPLDYGPASSEEGEKAGEYAVTLREILDHIETYSCNYSIEVLTKYLGYKDTGSPGSWEAGSEVIARCMGELGLDMSGVSIVDGSGLSRLNLVSTSFLSDLVLRIIGRGDRDFISLLPSPGKGTLRGRLHDLSDYGINAKTGSINHCSSLTGYIGATGGSFSIIINNSTGTDKEMQGEIDGILRNHIASRQEGK